MLRSSHDACGCSTQTTSTINLKRSTLHPHEGQADRPNTPSDSVSPGSNPGPPATNPSDIASYFWFWQSLEREQCLSPTWLPARAAKLREFRGSKGSSAAAFV